MRRLDGLFDQLLNDVGARNVFLKLDTQGWDLEVLRGASACISRIGAVQSEIPLKTIYKEMPAFMEIIAEANRLGLDITGMFPVSRDTRGDVRFYPSRQDPVPRHMRRRPNRRDIQKRGLTSA